MHIFLGGVGKLPKLGLGRLNVEVSVSHAIKHTNTHARAHTHTHTHTHTNNLQGSSERVIRPSKGPLTIKSTINKIDNYPCPQRASNQRSQQSNGFQPTL